MSILSTRMRRAMFASGVRQFELAERTGLDKAQISSYLHDKYKPNGESITKLAAALGVTPAWLVGEGPDDLPALSKKALERSVSDAPLPFKDNRVNVIGEVAAGVPHFRFHDLRSFFASIALSSAVGVGSRTVQDLGGWQTDRVMKSHYDRSISDVRKKDEENIIAFFSRNLSVNS